MMRATNSLFLISLLQVSFLQTSERSVVFPALKSKDSDLKLSVASEQVEDHLCVSPNCCNDYEKLVRTYLLLSPTAGGAGMHRDLISIVCQYISGLERASLCVRYAPVWSKPKWISGGTTPLDWVSWPLMTSEVSVHLLGDKRYVRLADIFNEVASNRSGSMAKELSYELFSTQSWYKGDSPECAATTRRESVEEDTIMRSLGNKQLLPPNALMRLSDHVSKKNLVSLVCRVENDADAKLITASREALPSLNEYGARDWWRHHDGMLQNGNFVRVTDNESNSSIFCEVPCYLKKGPRMINYSVYQTVGWTRLSDLVSTLQKDHGVKAGDRLWYLQHSGMRNVVVPRSYSIGSEEPTHAGPIVISTTYPPEVMEDVFRDELFRITLQRITSKKVDPTVDVEQSAGSVDSNK